MNGGAGLIGSHLVRRLLRDGHRSLSWKTCQPATENLEDCPVELVNRDLAAIVRRILGGGGRRLQLAAVPSATAFSSGTAAVQRRATATLRTYSGTKLRRTTSSTRHAASTGTSRCAYARECRPCPFPYAVASSREGTRACSQNDLGCSQCGLRYFKCRPRQIQTAICRAVPRFVTAYMSRQPPRVIRRRYSRATEYVAMLSSEPTCGEVRPVARQ